MQSNGEILRRSGGFAAPAPENDSPLRQAARPCRRQPTRRGPPTLFSVGFDRTSGLTCTWEATDQAPVVQAAHPALTHAAGFQWMADGWQMITVTVSALEGIISDTHRVAIGTVTGSTLEVWQPRSVYLPLVLRLWP